MEKSLDEIIREEKFDRDPLAPRGPRRGRGGPPRSSFGDSFRERDPIDRFPRGDRGGVKNSFKSPTSFRR